MKKFSLFVFLVLVGFFCSCGSDTESSAANPDDEISSSNSHGSEKDSEKSSSSFVPKSVTEASVVDYDKYAAADLVVEAVDGKKYKTLKLGPVIWMTENMNSIDPLNVKSTCYGYDESKCDTYGRVYLNNDDSEPEHLCPEGFTLPSIGVWIELAESGVDFSPVFAGTCTKNDTLQCKDLKQSVRYLAYNDKSIVFTKDSSGKVSYKVQYSHYTNDFYSLRCVKYRSIVKNLSDLPLCDTTIENVPNINVLEKNANYYCSGYYETWEESSSINACSSMEKGDFYREGDALLYCNGSQWSFATIQNVNLKCTKDSLYKEYVLNGARYACLDDGWEKLGYPDSLIGYCHKGIKGKIGKPSEDKAYICDSTGWRLASIIDMYDTCTEKRYDKIVDYNSKKWICLATGWKQGSDVDQNKGFCTKKMQDSVVTYAGSYYKCDADDRMWRKEPVDDYLDPCDSTNEGATAMVDTVKYMCYGDHGWFVYDSTLVFIEPID